MTTTLSATATATEVRLRVITDAPGAVLVEVLRAMGGRTVQVRAWPGIDGAWVHTDIDITYGAPLTYQARVYDAAENLLEVSATAGPVTATSTTAYMRNALIPVQKVPLRMVGQEAGDSTTDVRRELLRPLGRSRPIAITDVRQGSEGTASFLTLTKDEQASVERLLESGDILLFAGPQGFSLTWPFYFSAGGVSVSRVSAALSDARLWSMDWSEVEPPPVTEPVPPVTWQELLDKGTTWESIRLTPWVDVMYPPVVPARLRVG